MQLTTYSLLQLDSLNGLSDIQEGTYRYAGSKSNNTMVHIRNDKRTKQQRNTLIALFMNVFSINTVINHIGTKM